jgi:hypothetical protein
MVVPWSCWNERSGAFTVDGQSDRFEFVPANLQIRRVRRLKFQNLKLTLHFH